MAFEVSHQSLLKFHRALRNKKYSLLFSAKSSSPGRKGYSREIINLILEIKTKNPSYGCPRIALLVKEVLSIEIDEETVRRILKK